LEGEVYKLQVMVNQKDEENKLLKIENNTLKTELGKLKGMCIAFEKKIFELKKEIKEINSKNAELERCKSFTQYFIKKMGKALEDSAKKKEEWEKKEIELNKQLKLSNNALKPYVNAVSNQSFKITYLEEQKKNLLSTVVHVRNKEAASNVKINALISEKEELEKELERQKYLAEFYGTIANNAKDLVSILPIHSVIRYPIMKELIKKLKLVEASEYFGISKSAFSRVNNNADPTILDWFFSVERDHIVSRIDVQAIVDFWFENCPVPSGSKRTVIDFKLRVVVPVYIQRVSTFQLHKQYLEKYPSDPVSLPTLLKYKPFNVKMKRMPTKADLIDTCPHCLILKDLINKEKKGEALTTKEKKLKKEKETHFHQSIEQMRYYVKLRADVEKDPNSILIIQDFTKFYVNEKRYNDLMISILARDPKSGQHRWLYFDFVEKGGGSNQDYYFVRSVWRYLLGEDELPSCYRTSSEDKIDPRTLLKEKKIHIFSDGAPQHFKQKKTISFWATLQIETGIILDVHFFCSYHGHNVCDAHSSHMKIKVLRTIREIGVENLLENEFLKAISELKNTHIFYLQEDGIDREAPLLDVQFVLEKPLAGIRSFHHFTLEKKDGTFYFNCSKLSSDLIPTKSIKLPKTQEQNLEATLHIMQEQMKQLEEELAKKKEELKKNEEELAKKQGGEEVNSNLEPKGKEEMDDPINLEEEFKEIVEDGDYFNVEEIDEDGKQEIEIANGTVEANCLTDEQINKMKDQIF